MEEQNQRILLAFALSFAILMVWRIFFMKTIPPVPKPSPAAPAKAPVTSAPKPAAAAPRASSAASVLEGSEAEEIVVEGDLYRLTLSTEGAVIKSWVLKKYRDEKGDLLDVVNQPACDQVGYPMGLSLADQTLSEKLNRALYVVRLDAYRSYTVFRCLPATFVQFLIGHGRVEQRVINHLREFFVRIFHMF